MLNEEKELLNKRLEEFELKYGDRPPKPTSEMLAEGFVWIVPKPALSDIAYAECENAALTRLCKIKQHKS